MSSDNTGLIVLGITAVVGSGVAMYAYAKSMNKGEGNDKGNGVDNVVGNVFGQSAGKKSRRGKTRSGTRRRRN